MPSRRKELRRSGCQRKEWRDNKKKSKHDSSASSSTASPHATCPVNKIGIDKNESEEAKKRVRVEEPAREHRRAADELDENLMFDIIMIMMRIT